ncbi:MAG TPA: hypothetical protein VIV56_07325 [Gemmatimonadales bacterium]
MTTRAAALQAVKVLAFEDSVGANSSAAFDLYDLGPPEGLLLFMGDAESTATIKFEHCDTSGGSYADLVTDAQLAASGAAVRAVAVDISRCKQFIKATWSGAGAVYAAIVALPKYRPVS